MASVPTNSADDVGGKILLFLALKFAMADASAILADLVFVITKRTVKSCKFSQLVSLVVILTFRSRSSLTKMISGC